jgi:hypothetical protein
MGLTGFMGVWEFRVRGRHLRGLFRLRTRTPNVGRVFNARGWRVRVELSQPPDVYNVVITTLQPVEHYRELLPEDLVERWKERAALLEYEGRLSRKDAAWQACLCGKGRSSHDVPLSLALSSAYAVRSADVVTRQRRPWPRGVDQRDHVLHPTTLGPAVPRPLHNGRDDPMHHNGADTYGNCSEPTTHGAAATPAGAPRV